MIKIKSYGILFLLLLVTEIAIALFHFHSFVRGFVGDVLVIPLVYAFIQMIVRMSMKKAVLITLSIAFIIELLQALKLAEIMDITNRFIRIILGSTFDPLDLVAYTIGVIPILIIEKYFSNGNN